MKTMRRTRWTAKGGMAVALLGAVVPAATPPAGHDYHAGRAPRDLAEAPVFAVEWPAADATVAADVSFLLETPAGGAGRIRSADGRLVRPDGRRFRLWGVNVTGAAGLPARAHAPRLAAALARAGVNCVRFHFLDRVAPRGLIAAGRNDTRALDPAQLERLDFFVAELKRRGIYTNLNLNVARPYLPGDGVKDHELLGFAKALTFFDPRLRELQREYARQLLTHRNPHTGATYAQEPAVAIVELVNENSLVEAWMNGRLRGTNVRRNPGTWTDIPASYAADLDARFDAWLRENYPAEQVRHWRERAGVAPDAPLPRLAPDQFAAAPVERFHAEAEFYLAIERDFYLGMAKFLREELGVGALLVGNSDHGHHRTGYPQLAGTSLLDIVDGHVYWQHPSYQTEPQTGRQIGFRIGNTPMVDDPLHSTVVELSRSAFAGQPYTVSEVNHPYPHEFAAEGIPILAAYAALHDWDGLFWYTLAHDDIVAAEPRFNGHFDLAPDPVKMAQLPVGALLFLRGDVRPAQRTIARSYTRAQVREGIRLTYRERPYFTPGFPPDLPLRHGSRISSLDGAATGTFPAAAAGPTYQADTGELTWHAPGLGAGLVTIDTARSQALIGFLGRAGTAATSLRHLAVEAPSPFGAITLAALDDRPITSSARLLVTAGGRVANSGQEWNAARNSLVNRGGAPTRIEPVRAALRLRGLAGARGVRLTPLDGAGRVTGAGQPGRRDGNEWRVELAAVAVSYLVTVER